MHLGAVQLGDLPAGPGLGPLPQPALLSARTLLVSTRVSSWGKMARGAVGLSHWVQQLEEVLEVKCASLGAWGHLWETWDKRQVESSVWREGAFPASL